MAKNMGIDAGELPAGAVRLSEKRFAGWLHRAVKKVFGAEIVVLDVDHRAFTVRRGGFFDISATLNDRARAKFARRSSPGWAGAGGAADDRGDAILDRLPLTTSFLEMPGMLAMRGKRVKAATVEQALNQKGVKEIEKQLAKSALEQFKRDGQAAFDYNEFEAVVRMSIVPLRHIESSAYKDYGLDRLPGLADMTDTQDCHTVVMNFPGVSHGETGHFEGDYTRGIAQTKYVAKGLGDGSWVAMDARYSNEANEQTIQRYVGTAGSERAVRDWIEKRHAENRGYGGPDGSALTAGLYGHFRVWLGKDNGKAYIAEVQSDFFQHHSAKKKLVDGDRKSIMHNPAVKKFLDEYRYTLDESFSYLENDDGNTREATDEEYLAAMLHAEHDGAHKIMEERLAPLEAVGNSDAAKDIEGGNDEFAITTLKEGNKLRTQAKNALKLLDSLEKGYVPTPAESQFIASQKAWERRLLHEAFRYAVDQGAEGGLPSMAEARKDILPSQRKYLERVWDGALNHPEKSPLHPFFIGTPTPELVKEISRVLDRPVNSKRQVIRLGNVRHIKKRHGEGGTAVEGQVPITKNEFALTPDILKNFDSVEAGHETTGGDGVLITRNYSDGTGVIVEAVPVKGDLEIRSFRIEEVNSGKAGHPSNYAPQTDAAPGYTSETHKSHPTANNNTGDSRQKVNRESKKSFGVDDDITPLTEKQWNKLLARLKKTGLAKDVITDAAEMRRALEKYGKDAAARFMSVWHGSRHAFDRFSLYKIGAGEGNQAFGWGLYFTELKDIAESYTTAGVERSDIKVRVNGKEVTYLHPLMEAQIKENLLVAAVKSKYGNLREARELLERRLKNGENTDGKHSGYRRGDREMWEEALKILDEGGVTVDMPNKNLYDVKIHGDRTVDELNFIRWDKPLTKGQRDAILKQLRAEKISEDVPIYTELIAILEDDSHKNTGFGNGDGIYVMLTKVLNGKSDKAASEFLLRAGIDGIRYPTGYRSKGIHEDSYNYVVFDDKVVDIVEHIRLMATPGGEVYGFATKDEKIYLDPEKMNANTPIHEYGHLWIDLVRENNKPLYNKLMGAVGQTDVFKEVRVDPAYAHLKPRERHEEVVARAIASVGEGMFTRKEERAGAVERLMEALQELWDWVMEKLGAGTELSGMSAGDVVVVGSRMTLEEFAEGAARELLGGRRVGEASAGGGKYISSMSIKTDSAGNQYVDVDLTADIQQKLRAAGSIKERQRIVYRYVMDNLRGKYPTSDGRVVNVTARSADELLHGAHEDRIRVIPELANIIKVGRFADIKDATHKIFKKFAYYDVALKIGSHYYTANMNIGIREDGESVLYRINQFKETAVPFNIGRVPVPAPVKGAAVNNNISDPGAESKEKVQNLSGGGGVRFARRLSSADRERRDVDPRWQIIQMLKRDMVENKVLLPGQSVVDAAQNWGHIPKSAKDDPQERNMWEGRWTKAEAAFTRHAHDEPHLFTALGFPMEIGDLDEFSPHDVIDKMPEWVNDMDDGNYIDGNNTGGADADEELDMYTLAMRDVAAESITGGMEPHEREAADEGWDGQYPLPELTEVPLEALARQTGGKGGESAKGKGERQGLNMAAKAPQDTSEMPLANSPHTDNITNSAAESNTEDKKDVDAVTSAMRAGWFDSVTDGVKPHEDIAEFLSDGHYRVPDLIEVPIETFAWGKGSNKAISFKNGGHVYEARRLDDGKWAVAAGWDEIRCFRSAESGFAEINKLSMYFKYPPEVRTLIYTTNAIEGFNRQLRKVTKSKGVFPTDNSLLKMLYLAMTDITRKWKGVRKDWYQIRAQLEIFFPDRLREYALDKCEKQVYEAPLWGAS